MHSYFLFAIRFKKHKPYMQFLIDEPTEFYCFHFLLPPEMLYLWASVLNEIPSVTHFRDLYFFY